MSETYIVPSLCEFCAVPETISDPWISLHDTVETYYSRWATLLKENLREAILISGMSMDEFDGLYTYAVTNLEELSINLNIDATDFDTFIPQWSRVFATFYQETLHAYKTLYAQAMNAAADIQTISDTGFGLEPSEQTLLDAAQATTDGPKRLEEK